jgi:hypothetical protein
MSKEHFRIISSNSAFYIEDLGSTNGTCVNGMPINSGVKHRLEESSVIRAGRTIFVFHANGAHLLDPIPNDTCGMAGRFHLAPLIKNCRLTHTHIAVRSHRRGQGAVRESRREVLSKENGHSQCGELAVFLRAVQGWYKTKAKELGFCNLQGGSVSFIQKFGSSLNATPHYHCLVLDGGYTFSDDSSAPFFVATPPPTDEDVKQIAETVARRVIRL